MNIRIALSVLAVMVASPALAQGFEAGSPARAPAPTLQGQKAWDFLAPAPARNAGEGIVTEAAAARAREAGPRPAK
ncbi:hypothetical protein EEDFHM_00961 [Methylorubrum populi]